MPGGQMSLAFVGTADQILVGEPKKSFWTYSYNQYSQFGKQHFRVDFDGQRDLRLTEPSKFSFTMPRYADLISDIVISVTLPNIWSPSIIHAFKRPINGHPMIFVGYVIWVLNYYKKWKSLVGILLSPNIPDNI
jgi:hypothetical protein